jgi:hypothetical protein
MPYVRQFTDPDEILLAYGIQASLAFLLLIVCANVGLLILARTLARPGELAIRNAMGASRRRIIGQLFGPARPSPAKSGPRTRYARRDRGDHTPLLPDRGWALGGSATDAPLPDPG